MSLKVIFLFFLVACCNGRNDNGQELGFSRRDCDVPYAYRVLKDHSQGTLYCEEHCPPSPPYTKTVTTIVDVTATKCATTTSTTTKIETVEVWKTKTTTLPKVTKTHYSSTVFVPSGTHRPINHNHNEERFTERQDGPDPALQGCSHDTIYQACSSLTRPAARPTTTETVTSTIPCTSTVQATTVQNATITRTTTMRISPPALHTRKTGVFTTTIPYQCAQEAYKPHGNGDPKNVIRPIQYPYFPYTGIECCAVCYTYNNCVASAFIKSGLDCQLLIRRDVNRSVHERGGNCTAPDLPEDYPFRMPHPKFGNTFPGPCGY